MGYASFCAFAALIVAQHYTPPKMQVITALGTPIFERVMAEVEVVVEKNEDSEGPIPTVWRSKFTALIEAFVEGDYSNSIGVPGVAPIPIETAQPIKAYIEEYGEELISLPNETWESSIYIWMGSHWDVLIDLWTKGEGRSDLVLGAKVAEIKNGFYIEVGMVYVP